MATVEVELRNYKKRKTKIVDGKKVIVEQPDGLQPLVLRVTSGKVVSRRNTGLYIKASEWDPNKRRVNRKHSKWAQLNDALDVLCKEAEGVKADIIKDRQLVTGKAVLDRVFSTRDFYAVVQAKIKTIPAEQSSNVESYTRMATRLKAFAPVLSIEEITPAFLEAFKVHLQTKAIKDEDGKYRGYAHNTVVETLKTLRATLNTVEIKGEHPFDRVTVGTFRRSEAPALDMSEIQKIRNFIPANRRDRLAKDLFLFSFYAAGMRSSDVLQLRWADIANDRVTYVQGKKMHTGAAKLSIPLNAVTREILSRYDRSTETVFDLVTKFGGSKAAHAERHSAQNLIRTGLRKIAAACGITKPVNFKLARTSFAQIANELSGRNVYGVQQTMGHSDIKTTEIYLGSDKRAVDELLKVVYG